MRYYETLYIVHPDYEEQRLNGVQREVDQRVAKNGGSIIDSYVWGKRRLAYPVSKHRYGTYMLLNYETDKPFVSELNQWLELHEAILAHITIHLDEKPEPKERKPMETAPATRKEGERPRGQETSQDK